MKLGAVIVLYLAGCLLVMSEIYLPGGVLGLLGLAAYVTAAAIVFKTWSAQAGIFFVCLEILGVLVALFAGMKVLPTTRALSLIHI